ncbi:MAG TPA: SDR family NAD(P)-dependent oxidoreductase [Actinophytocola sp.]|uniref:SDR family NAD(P)-dependent oxidoreductase n=1 Tax=Actinophytocola sp. TaxID=1872138 RepID=UPI002DDDA307|nr:SDR family NAD(P)-dependent oxidoreductase [Actinophytocola sp.]HEV2782973.1 SDR family NAD(P)-dependent oxidoreductase [Actinophytocola sp.]
MRTVVITGGSGGLGSAVSAAFVTAGWRVVVPWIMEAELSRLTPEVRTIRADLFDPDSAADVAAFAAGEPGAPLAAVVNLVGGFAVGGRVHETPVADFERQLRLNLRPTYLMSHAALPHLIAAGGGSIVCVSSRAAVRPFPGAAGYVTAKAGVLALVDAMAVEYRDDGIRVNAVLPSVIDTPVNRAEMPDADFSTWVTPAEIAGVIRFLCEDSSGVISGAHVPVYGRA